MANKREILLKVLIGMVLCIPVWPIRSKYIEAGQLDVSTSVVFYAAVFMCYVPIKKPTFWYGILFFLLCYAVLYLTV